MTQLDLKLTPRRAALPQGGDTEIDVLVSIDAPEAPLNLPQRAPLNLAIVIDRSGSMAGRPLAEAKKCAAFMAEGLLPSDRAAVITFDQSVDVVVPSMFVDRSDTLLMAINAIRSGGQTALHEGWLRGAEQAAPYVAKDVITRVLLLTDGQANVGETRSEAIAADCGRLADAGVTTSTYGLGNGFNEDLLGAMAQSGGGQTYYGETAEDLMDPFREEFDLLRSLCGRKLRLRINAAPGVDAKILNAYRTDAEGWAMLPEVAFGGTAWALVRLTVPRDVGSPGEKDVLLMTAEATYEDMEGGSRTCTPANLRLPRIPAVELAGLVSDPVVAARAGELRAAELQDQARIAARAGDWDHVDRLLAVARAEAGDNQWVAASIGALEEYAGQRDLERFSKSAYLSSRKMMSRLAGKDELGDYSAAFEAKKQMFLRRKPRQGKDLGEGEP